MKSILIKRDGALGDVLCVTPLVRHLVNLGHHVAVETRYPEVFDGMIPSSREYPHMSGADYVVDLNLAYEHRPRMHVVDAYREVAIEVLGEKGAFEDKSLSLEGPRIGGRPDDRRIGIHAARSWSNRTIPVMFWNNLAWELSDLKYEVCFFGSGADYHGHQLRQNGFHRVQAMGPFSSLADLRFNMETCGTFIGSDSALLHLAGTTRSRIVGLYTSVLGSYRIPYREGVLAGNAAVLQASVPCAGCLADIPPPVTHVSCRYGTDACVSAFKVEDVVNAIAGEH